MKVATEILEVGIDDPHYPPALREIADPPAKIYIRGNLSWSKLPWVAMVGSRKPTAYGAQVATMLGERISPGCVVVSGLAYGIDGLAHQAALRQGSITVAVLGSGLDDANIYPAKHRDLAHRIIEAGGALISEHPPGTPPLRHHFPLRNRIIAGLSEKIVVVEAAEGSGALITAKVALDYNREVLAVPGPITSLNSAGTNWLISQGAVPVMRAEDIVRIKPVQAKLDLTDVEELVYKSLVSGAKHLDELVHITQLDTARVTSTLTILELRGVVRGTGNGTFSAVKNIE